MNQIGRYLSYVLRHRPDELGLELDTQGWCPAPVLLERLREKKRWQLTLEDLERVVASDSKGRFSLREGKIRANQGHSIDVQAIELLPVAPPPLLYHGTTVERWEKIRTSGGLAPMQRHHVHLSEELETARQVGSRHRRETLLVLKVDAAAMAARGMLFYRSENGVWMADSVPLEFLCPL